MREETKTAHKPNLSPDGNIASCFPTNNTNLSNDQKYGNEHNDVKHRNIATQPLDSEKASTGSRYSKDVKLNDEESPLKKVVLRTFAPIFLVLACPNAVILLWYTVAHCNGSFAILLHKFSQDGVSNVLFSIWSNIDLLNPLAYILLLLYIAFQVVLMKIIPGEIVYGPITRKGNQQIYKDNGFFCYVISLAVFLVITLFLYTCTSYSTTIIFDRFDQVIATLNVFSLVICCLLCIKGWLYPSTSDSGSSGNICFDYYWGVELYPRVCGVDIKVLTNCRFGMTVWSLLVLIFAMKNYETYGFVPGVWTSTILQTTYFFKFFWWEAGYMNTIDIILDRAGFYICWGCLVFIPGLYASVSLYLATCPTSLGNTSSLLVLFTGLACCFINYWADWQKQIARQTNGKCLIWGKEAEVIVAEYEIEGGGKKTSLLLVSGFWRIARHFHYLPELILAICWSVPCGFSHLMPYSYLSFLLILLIHRTYRDDTKCRNKYTRYWSEYCTRVPYKILPYIF